MSIRATALACQKPLQDFLAKISKFESRLGTFNAAKNRWKGLPRKMQFRTMFKEDVKQLRSALASHVATINLLLMTQTVASILAAEDDRDHLASSLESKILWHRRHLEDVNGRIEKSLERQQGIKSQLRDQSSVLDELGKKADETHQQLSSQAASIQGIQTITNHTKGQTKSILATVTEILALVTSGAMHLRQIIKQLHMLFRLCNTFTAETRTAMSKLMELFHSLQTTLQRIDCSLPMRLYPPIVQFTTALGGEPMALPYELCQQWTTFKELLRVIFLDKPGKARVDMGKYLIMNARGGRLLAKGSWQHAVKQDDHLSMSIVLDELAARAGSCPFPTCQATTEGVEVENGGRTCRKCGRWSLLKPPDSSHIKLKRTRTPADEDTDSDTDSESLSDSNNGAEEDARPIEDNEDIELYRQIQVFDWSQDKLAPQPPSPPPSMTTSSTAGPNPPMIATSRLAPQSQLPNHRTISGYHIRFSQAPLEYVESRNCIEPHFNVKTKTFKNSIWNRAHYGNPDFHPEEWSTGDEHVDGRVGGKRKMKKDLS